MKKQDGFTVIELIFIIALLIGAGILFFIQKNDIEASARDNIRKSRINAIHYGLEEDFYAKNKFYPEKLSKNDIKTIDPDSFKDPYDQEIGTQYSEFRYEPSNCNDHKCKKYTLHSAMEKEAEYTKNSRNK